MRSARVLRVVILCLGALIAMVLVTVGWANADSNHVGTTAANFLEVGAGPRILGMGGATIGIGRDLAAGAWNPAALGWMDESSLAISHAGLENESMQEWAAVGGRLGASQTRWSFSGLFQNDGTFDARDASNTSIGTFSATSFALGLHVAQQIGGSLTVGAGAKSVTDKLGDATGAGVTFDAGLMFRKGALGLGAAARNVGGRMKYAGSSYDFPTCYGFGGSLAHAASGLSAALDVNFPVAYYRDIRAGAEWRWKDQVAIRGGYRQERSGETDPLSGPTFGVGAGRGGFWFDYGYLVAGNGSGEHRLALTLFPSRWGALSDPYGKGEMPSERESQLNGPPPPKTASPNRKH